MDACLINANLDFEFWRLQKKTSLLALSYLSSSLKENNYEVHIIDAFIENLENEEVVDRVMDINPKVVAISCIQYNQVNSFTIIESLREKGYKGHITIGGHFPTLNHDQIIERFKNKIDSISMGEGEKVIVNLVKNITDGESIESLKGIVTEKSINKCENLIEDLDSIPFPDRYYEKKNKFDYISMLSSRGCYGTCSYCAIQSFYSYADNYKCNKWRGHSVPRVISEIEYMIKLFRQHTKDEEEKMFIEFVDDNFIGLSRSRAARIAEEIIKRGLNKDIQFALSCRPNDVEYDLFKLLKEAGLQRLFIGIEFGEDCVFEKYNRKSKSKVNNIAIDILTTLGIETQFGYMGFHPYATFEEVKRSHEMMKRLGYQRFPNEFGQMILNTGTEVEKTYQGQKFTFKRNPLIVPKMGIVWGYDYKIEDELVNTLKNSFNIHHEELALITKKLSKIKKVKNKDFKIVKKILSKRYEKLFDVVFQLEYVSCEKIKEIFENDIKNIKEAVDEIYKYYINDQNEIKMISVCDEELLMLKSTIVYNILKKEECS